MNNQKVWVEVAHGLRLSQPEGCSAAVYVLMSRCWSDKQSDRPSFADMTAELRRIYEETTGEGVPMADHIYLSPASLSDGASAYDDSQPVMRRDGSAYDGAELHMVGVLPGAYAETPGVDLHVDASALNDMAGCGEQRDAQCSQNSATRRVYDSGAENVHDMGSSDTSRESPTRIIGIQMQNPLFDAKGGSRASASHETASIHDHAGVYDLAQSGKVMRSVAGTLRVANVERQPPQQQRRTRVLDLGFDEEATNTDVPIFDDVYDNHVGTGVSHAGEGAVPPICADDVGKRVTVMGYDCQGTLRFYGMHAKHGTLRCGVEFDDPVGKNDGTIEVGCANGRR